MKEADLKKMGEILDEMRQHHAALVEGVKIVHRQLQAQLNQMQLMEDEFHIASQLSEPEN